MACRQKEGISRSSSSSSSSSDQSRSSNSSSSSSGSGSSPGSIDVEYHEEGDSNLADQQTYPMFAINRRLAGILRHNTQVINQQSQTGHEKDHKRMRMSVSSCNGIDTIKFTLIEDKAGDGTTRPKSTAKEKTERPKMPTQTANGNTAKHPREKEPSRSGLLINDKYSFERAMSQLRGKSTLACQCRGIKLSRTGKLCLFILGTATEIFIFDLLKHGEMFFAKGLRKILEAEYITKLFYDCREQCNALMYQFDVNVQAVYDVQLLDFTYKLLMDEGAAEFVSGFDHSVRYHLPDVAEATESERELVRGSLADDQEIWSRRPLSPCLVEAIKTEIKILLALKEKIAPATMINYGIKEETLDGIVSYGSERYANFVRQNTRYKEGSVYFTSSRLPISIMPYFNTTRPDKGALSCVSYISTFYPVDETAYDNCATCGQPFYMVRDFKCERCVQIEREATASREY